MENFTKYMGGLVLLALIMGHMLLLMFFLTPSHILLATVLSDDLNMIEVSDIPMEVQDFLVQNKIEVIGEAAFNEDFKGDLVSAILKLRERRFMGDAEKLSVNLNTLNYGENIVGIDSASEYYFQKPATELESAQWLTLINLQKIFSK